MAFRVPETARIAAGPMGSTAASGNNGAFLLRRGGLFLWVVASDGRGWEHVSVHASYDPRGKRQRAPTWEEMCFVKAAFWGPEDVVMELHPRASEYVNWHPYTLHLWRPVGAEIPTPPAILVGPR